MSYLNRRTVLRSTLIAAAALSLRRAGANPFGLPLGLQLYSVRQGLAKDYAGTLVQVAAAGYREVEAAGYYGKTALQVRSAMQAAGLRCVSAHYAYDDLANDLGRTLAFNREVGVDYLICSFPGIKDPSRLSDLSYANRVRSFTLDDYRWNAEKFNELGAQVKAAGMRFGYHNHTMEFAPQQGIVPLEELLRLTDPTLVTLELDCGWVVVGGANPEDYLRRFASRISMLHVKDFKKASRPATAAEPPRAAELGRGVLDYRKMMAAVRPGSLRHLFVEQEGFSMPVFEALKIDADYIRAIPG